MQVGSLSHQVIMVVMDQSCGLFLLVAYWSYMWYQPLSPRVFLGSQLGWSYIKLVRSS